MPAPRLRSRSLRRVFRKVPGGRTSLQYKRRNPKAAKCGRCGAVLMGIPRALPHKVSRLAKSKRRPQRPYGGVLCTRCTRELMVEKARQ